MAVEVTKLDYFRAYQDRYMTKEQDRPVLLYNVVSQDIFDSTKDWLGIDSFLKEWVRDGLFGESYFNSVLKTVFQYEKKNRVRILAERYSVFLAWDTVEVLCFLEHLEKERAKKGLGGVLESIALTDSQYYGAIVNLAEADKGKVERFSKDHDGLLEFLMNHFYLFFEPIVNDQEKETALLNFLERGDIENTLSILIPEPDEIVGGMLNAIGFYHYLKVNGMILDKGRER